MKQNHVKIKTLMADLLLNQTESKILVSVQFKSENFICRTMVVNQTEFESDLKTMQN